MDQGLNLKGKESKQSLTLSKKQTSEEFLLKKETELGKTITPRFREYFYRELNRISNRTYEQVWESVFGRA
ncbi:hypothetical protein [Leptospira alexanderi]|uniref:Uncharacterized protein n=1 Tax=Leptospira alexanderi serovar Manhao 3 str. L 60 TaxID=1049759 RepID=V6HUM8_9LEPT|nr:hypothetical protein [Leptospira alexanderi]EQA61440.1 hypothetical protein LEP1GSC062_4299 [Leptospira alexanderi serovar Manhao 3 str. L 60]